MNFKETHNDRELLIFLAALFCCIVTDAFLLTGLDLVAIPAACALAAWTGIRQPLADPAQIYRGWGLAGVVACVFMFISAGGVWVSVAAFNASHRGDALVIDGFWMLIAMPVVGILCAINGRRWKHDGSRLARVRLLLLTLGVSFSPWIALRVMYAFSH